MTHWRHARVCVPTYMRNTYPGVGSVLRAIIACRPEDSLRPVLSYPSSSLAIVPRQTHDHNPSFPLRLADPFSRSSSCVNPARSPHPYRPPFALFLSLEGESTCRILWPLGLSFFAPGTLAFLRGNGVVYRSTSARATNDSLRGQIGLFLRPLERSDWVFRILLRN